MDPSAISIFWLLLPVLSVFNEEITSYIHFFKSYYIFTSILKLLHLYYIFFVDKNNVLPLFCFPIKGIITINFFVIYQFV